MWRLVDVRSWGWGYIRIIPSKGIQGIGILVGVYRGCRGVIEGYIGFRVNQFRV